MFVSVRRWAGAAVTLRVFYWAMIAAAMLFGATAAEARIYRSFVVPETYLAPRAYDPGIAYTRPRWMVMPPARPARSKRKSAEQTHKALPPSSPKGPLLIAIAIANQRLTLYDNGIPIAQSPVSTGMAAHPTPMGVFSVIQKQRWHRSNIYSGAPMPYMQRITWSGVALHAGVLPGYPASHGCIRLPTEFAIRLWHTTRTGARVIIARNEIAPVEIAHPRLFVRRQKPAEPPLGVNRPADAGKRAEIKPTLAPEVAMVTDSTPAAEIAVADGDATGTFRAPEALGLRPAQATFASIDAQPSASAPANNSAGPADLEAEIVIPPVSQLLPAVEEKRLRSGPISVFVSRKERKLFVRKGFEPLFDAPVGIERPDQMLGTHVFTAMEVKDDGATMRWTAVSLPAEPAKVSKVERRAQAEMKVTRNGRAQKTASDVLETRPPISAAEALDRIDMPKDAVDRISNLLSVGASLVISDQGLGPETGQETDFIVLSR